MSLQVGFIASLKNEKSHLIVEQVSTQRPEQIVRHCLVQMSSQPKWCPNCRHAKRWAVWSIGVRAQQTTTQEMVPEL